MEPISEIAQSAFAEILLDQAVTTPLESLLQQQTPDPAQRPGGLHPASQQPTPPSIDIPSRSEPELAPAIPSAADLREFWGTVKREPSRQQERG